MLSHKYVTEVLQYLCMSDCRSLSKPIEAGLELTKDMSPRSVVKVAIASDVPYQSAIGSLVRAKVATRPAIAAAVATVSAYVQNPEPQHWKAVRHILRSLKRNTDVVLQLGGKGLQLLGYCDADWAGDHDTRRTTTGYAFMLGSGSVA